MKSQLLTFVVLIFTCFHAFAQVPQGINYQAVARNASGQVLTNQAVAIRLSVLQSTIAGTIQYQERHTGTTNTQGLINLQIGGGTELNGTFADITWADGQPKYLQIELDPNGGNSYINMGVQQLASVPYAMVAGSVVGGGNAGWNLDGNANTDPDNHFVGTSDAQPLHFRVNNLPAGYIANETTNMSLGVSALNDVVNNTNNTAIGYQSMYNNYTGFNNVALGTASLGGNVAGSSNIAIGTAALYHHTDRDGLLAIGDSALYYNSMGTNSLFQAVQNTAIGNKALKNNTTGSFNTAIGYLAMETNNIGYANTALGAGALRYNSGGNFNIGMGGNALYNNTTGSSNVGIGYQCLTFNTTGQLNTAIGTNSMLYNTAGGNNTANGNEALLFNTLGTNNTAIGNKSLHTNSDGNNNTAVGAEALYSSISAPNNTAVGYKALYTNTTGYNNTANGHNALLYNATGYWNTAIGRNALYSNISGSDNVAIGADALGLNSTGFLNVALGSAAGCNANTNTNNLTSLGYNAGHFGSNSNTVEIGNTSMGWIGGQSGWFNYSDRRIKKNITDNVPGIAFINRLRPVTYNIDLHKENEIIYGNTDTITWEGKYDIEQITMTGFIAQEVELAAQTVNYNFSGVHAPVGNAKLYSISYASFVVPLVKAVQEQQQMIDTQKNEIAVLKTELEQIKQLILNTYK